MNWWSRIVPGKPRVIQPEQKFPASDRIHRFVTVSTVSTKACHKTYSSKNPKKHKLPLSSPWRDITGSTISWKWSVSCPSQFSPGERSPGTHWTRMVDGLQNWSVCIPLRYILKLTHQTCLNLPSGLWISCFLTKTWYVILLSPYVLLEHALPISSPATLTILAKKRKLQTPWYETFYSINLLSLFQVHWSPQHSLLQ
jgi:hypothetical protein